MPCLLQGGDAITFLETLVVGDIQGLSPGTGTLSVFTNDKGGIIDDTVITKVLDRSASSVLLPDPRRPRAHTCWVSVHDDELVCNLSFVLHHVGRFRRRRCIWS